MPTQAEICWGGVIPAEAGIFLKTVSFPLLKFPVIPAEAGISSKGALSLKIPDQVGNDTSDCHSERSKESIIHKRPTMDSSVVKTPSE